MGQSGNLDANKLMFADNPEKIEVVMGRCFPQSSSGCGYDNISIPIVRQIVYKNRDGATFTQTFSDAICSEKDNCMNSTSVKQTTDDKSECTRTSKIFVKPEASDATPTEVAIKRRSTIETLNREWQIGMDAENDENLSQAKQNASLAIDSEDIKRISAANSPIFRAKNKIESSKTSEISGKEAWNQTQEKKAKLREEFFRVPYEECNREAMHGMGGRLNKSEPRLNALAKERKKRNSLSYKRKVHFNMDDSQLEEIRKWREEKRMQATSPVIKTVAKIYSLDGPSSNQRQIEYVNSFSSPQPEVPVTMSIHDSPLTGTKTSRPTDLDSLQRQFISTPNLKNKASENTSNFKGSLNTDMKESISSELQGRLMAPSTEVLTMPRSQTHGEKPTAPTRQNLTAAPRLYDYCMANASPKHHQQIQKQSPSKNESIDLSHQNNFSPSILPQQLCPSTSYREENQQIKERQMHQNTTVQLNETSPMNIAGHSKDVHLQTSYPVPKPRSKSLVSRRDTSKQTSPSSYPSSGDTSVRSKIYGSRRATSLDRALASKRGSKLFESTESLKSPGLILNHLRSPTQAQITAEPVTNVMVESKSMHTQNNTEFSQQSKQSMQNTPPVSPRLEKTLLSANTPSTECNTDKINVGIIRSYTYPKRNSMTEMQIIDNLQDMDINSSSGVSDVNQNITRKDESQHPKPLKRNLIDNYTTETSPPVNTSTETLKNLIKGLNQDFNENLTHHPNFNTDTNSQGKLYKNHSSKSSTGSSTLQKFSSQPTQNDVNSHFLQHSKTVNDKIISNTKVKPKHESSASKNTNSSTAEKYHKMHYSNNINKNYNNINNSLRNPDTYQGKESSQYINQNHSFSVPSSTTNNRVTHKISNKENEDNKRSQKTTLNSNGNAVNILMTKGESYSKHRIVLNSHTKSMTPRVTVRKIIVPASSTSSSSVHVRSVPSPTPSCASSSCSFGSSGSSSGCFSGSPSPTPTPSPTRARASCVPTDL